MDQGFKKDENKRTSLLRFEAAAPRGCGSGLWPPGGDIVPLERFSALSVKAGEEEEEKERRMLAEPPGASSSLTGFQRLECGGWWLFCGFYNPGFAVKLNSSSPFVLQLLRQTSVFFIIIVLVVHVICVADVAQRNQPAVS